MCFDHMYSANERTSERKKAAHGMVNHACKENELPLSKKLCELLIRYRRARNSGGRCCFKANITQTSLAPLICLLTYSMLPSELLRPPTKKKKADMTPQTLLEN